MERVQAAGPSRMHAPAAQPDDPVGVMADFRDLSREYEARRFPEARRLDVHGDGPAVARERALRWIQSYAHEEPGQELLLIVERGRRPGRPPTPVRKAVERLLEELRGRLVDWWQDFGTGGLALRVSDRPQMVLHQPPRVEEGEGRTPETAGAAPLAAEHDIPDELLDLATRVAETRRDREGLSVGLMDVVLRRVWIEAQAMAMEERITFERALERLWTEERRRWETERGW